MLNPFGYLIPFGAIVVAFGIIMVLATSTVKILREYERAVVFTLGRFQRVKGPGMVILIPFVQEMVRVDLRTQVIEIPSQDVISHDNVSMKVDAVLYFNVVDPERAIIQVQHFLPATNMLAQTTLRAVLGQHELDEMLAERKMQRQRLGPEIDLDARDDPGAEETLDEQGPLAVALVQRLVEQDRTADEVTEAGRGHDHLAIGATVFHGRRDTGAGEPLVAGVRALVHREQTFARPDQRLGGCDQAVAHETSPHTQFRISGRSSPCLSM